MMASWTCDACGTVFDLDFQDACHKCGKPFDTDGKRKVKLTTFGRIYTAKGAGTGVTGTITGWRSPEEIEVFRENYTKDHMEKHGFRGSVKVQYLD